ncbi:hypothetical protein DSECCO2_444170 [anaerobic digester metagenome]
MHGVGCVQARALSLEPVQQRPQPRLRRHEQRVVVEGEIAHAARVLALHGGQHAPGAGLPESGVEAPAGAVRATERAASGTENDGKCRTLVQVQGQLQARSLGQGWSPAAQKPPEPLPDMRLLHAARQNQVRPQTRRVLRAQRGVDAAQDHGDARPDLAGHAYGLGRAGVPIGHDRGHEDEIGDRGETLQGVTHRVGVMPVSAVAPRHAMQGCRLGQRSLGVGPLARGMRLGPGGPGPCAVQAIHEGDAGAGGPQHVQAGQQTGRAGPEPVGREVVDPGVQAEDARAVPGTVTAGGPGNPAPLWLHRTWGTGWRCAQRAPWLPASCRCGPGVRPGPAWSTCCSCRPPARS